MKRHITKHKKKYTKFIIFFFVFLGVRIVELEVRSAMGQCRLSTMSDILLSISVAAVFVLICEMIESKFGNRF